MLNPWGFLARLLKAEDDPTGTAFMTKLSNLNTVGRRASAEEANMPIQCSPFGFLLLNRATSESLMKRVPPFSSSRSSRWFVWPAPFFRVGVLKEPSALLSALILLVGCLERRARNLVSAQLPDLFQA